jgi:hypothetical protein
VIKRDYNAWLRVNKKSTIKEEVEKLKIIHDEFHGEWYYTFKPKKDEAA